MKVLYEHIKQQNSMQNGAPVDPARETVKLRVTIEGGKVHAN